MPGGNAAWQIRRFSGNLDCSRKEQDKGPGSLSAPDRPLRPAVRGVSGIDPAESFSRFQQNSGAVVTQNARVMRVCGL